MRTSAKRLLLVEDDANFRETLALEFEDRGYNVCSASCARDYHASREQDFEYAVVDLKLAGENGIDVIEDLVKRSPKCRVVILTGYGSIATAVKAMRVGAIDYLTKPATVCAIERALKGDAALIESQAQSNELPTPSLARQEREYIERILAECHGNVTKAAEQLGIHRQSLQRKLRKFPVKR